MNDIPKMYANQEKSMLFLNKNALVFDTSDPGTGKTRAHLEAFAHRKKLNPEAKMLVLAPKTILQPSWGNDIDKFTPNLRYAIAINAKKAAAFAEPNIDIVITNHDSVKWIIRNDIDISMFTDITIDESPAFKHRTSQRSKACKEIVKHFMRIRLLSGTPCPTTITDIWHQLFLLDTGARLGDSFFRFRAVTCTPTQVGPSANMIKWQDIEGIHNVVADLIKDITIRHKFEDCISIPAHAIRTINIVLSPKVQKMYDELAKTTMLKLANSNITPFNAGVLRTKLLQLLSGAVYIDGSPPEILHLERYLLVADLVNQRDHSVVAFQWGHQKEQLKKIFDKQGITYRVIDGKTSSNLRNEAVELFQAGKIKVLLAHPACAAHGLTLTRGTTTIWPSPTDNVEHFLQFNKRIYRAGQTRRTETLLITAQNSIEEQIYLRAQGLIDNQTSLLDMLGMHFK